MSSTSSTKTIEVLRNLFASYGLPLQVVSDNGPQFVSQEFADFLKQNGVKHIRSTPYHPSTNGLAERFIQTFKKAMKASQHDSRMFTHRLVDFLLKYRISTHSTTNRSPCSLFLQRELRTRMGPESENSVMEKQALQKKDHDRRSKLRTLQVGDSVMAKNYREGPQLMPGLVVDRKGPLSYVIQLESGLLWRRHIDQLRLGPDRVVQGGSGTENSAGEPVVIEDTDATMNDSSSAPSSGLNGADRAPDPNSEPTVSAHTPATPTVPAVSQPTYSPCPSLPVPGAKTS